MDADLRDVRHDLLEHGADVCVLFAAQQLHHGAHVRQQLPGDILGLVYMGPPVRFLVARHLQIEDQRREVMADEIVQLARDPQPLAAADAVGQQALGGAQFRVRAREPSRRRSVSERAT